MCIIYANILYIHFFKEISTACTLGATPRTYVSKISEGRHIPGDFCPLKPKDRRKLTFF